MTKIEKLLCSKMMDLGYDIVMKKEGEKFTFINSKEKLTSEKLQQLEKMGIGVTVNANLPPYFYYKDDYEYKGDGIYKAKNDIVKSIPVSTLSISSVHETVSITGTVIDLTNFVGIAQRNNWMNVNTFILGADVVYNNTDIVNGHKSFLEILEKPSYNFIFDKHLQAFYLKIINSNPIYNVDHFLFGNVFIEKVDLSEANLTDCKVFRDFCGHTTKLKEILCSKIPEDADCSNAFIYSNLYPTYNSNKMQNNAIERLQVLKMDIPRMFPVIDTELLKVIATNLTKDQVSYLFPGYNCIISKWKSEIDINILPYAFVYKEVTEDSPEYENWLEIINSEFKKLFPVLCCIY